MQWTEQALILGVRRHGETSAMLEVMTRTRGRHLGLIRGGRSRRLAATLQPGNTVSAHWHARLDEHLGLFTVEALVLRAAELMESAVGVNAVQTLASLMRLLPERDPHPELYDAAEAIVGHLQEPATAGELVVRFELATLEALGFGLDLSQCALTGATADLGFVSPKTGRAASVTAGAAYADRLLKLPAFLVPQLAGANTEARRHGDSDWSELAAGFALSGHFLARHVYQARGIAAPDSRDRLMTALRRRLEPAPARV